jgi:choline dehydrogenase-like flavoprotein
MTTQLTDSQRAVLRALADTVVPSLQRDEDPTGFWAASGSDLGADVGVAHVLAGLPDEQRTGLLSLLDGLHVLGFATGSQRSREQLMRNVALMGAAPAAGMNALTSLTTALAYCAPDPTTGVNPTWKAFGYDGPPDVSPGGGEPLPLFVPEGSDQVLEADACIVGSGAGGGLIAGVLADAGLNVVVLEAGPSRNESDFLGYELPAFQDMFWRGGVTTTADMNVSMLAAATLGGGPTVNWSNCLRTPEWVRDHWAGEFGLKDVATPDFDEHIDAVWARLGVNDRCSDLNGPHLRMRDGAEALGWSFTTLSRNADPSVYSPESAGHIGFGDRSGAKIDVRRTYLRDAVEAGGRVIANCAAERVLVEGGRAAGVQATYTDPQTGARTALTVKAPQVVVACGSLESPALLLRSGIGGPAVGRYLHLHPVVAFLGIYPEETNPWWGAPMTAMVDEFANIEDGYGFLIQNAQWAPSIIAAGIARASGAEHKETIARLGNAAWLIGIPRDRGHGSVTIDDNGNAVVNYALTDEVDIRVARASIEKQIRLHHAAGAEQIVPFAPISLRWRRGDDLEAFIAEMHKIPLRAGGMRIFSAHQMSSCRMGTDPETSVANPSGELHDTPGVYVGDASAMPTASGANPMISAMSLAHRTAEAIAAAARPAVHA